jgi:hypothetical protein
MQPYQIHKNNANSQINKFSESKSERKGRGRGALEGGRSGSRVRLSAWVRLDASKFGSSFSGLRKIQGKVAIVIKWSSRRWLQARGVEVAFVGLEIFEIGLFDEACSSRGLEVAVGLLGMMMSTVKGSVKWSCGLQGSRS